MCRSCPGSSVDPYGTFIMGLSFFLTIGLLQSQDLLTPWVFAWLLAMVPAPGPISNAIHGVQLCSSPLGESLLEGHIEFPLVSVGLKLAFQEDLELANSKRTFQFLMLGYQLPVVILITLIGFLFFPLVNMFTENQLFEEHEANWSFSLCLCLSLSDHCIFT